MRGRRSPRLVQAALSASFEYANGGVQNFLWILAGGAYIFSGTQAKNHLQNCVFFTHVTFLIFVRFAS